MSWYVLNDLKEAVPSDVTSFQPADKRRVARTELAGGAVEISTVFLWLDHSYGQGPPILFETMVFGGLLDEECERYSTWIEAEQGHEAMVDRVRSTLDS